MLKDIFKNLKKDNKIEETSNKEVSKIIDRIKAEKFFDGYVDIKAYKNINGKKVMTYHDTGDNVVTNWMRQVVMTMLTGSNFSANGNQSLSEASYSASLSDGSNPISKPNSSSNYHTASTGTDTGGLNLDGYILNGEDYFWDADDMRAKYSASTISDNIYAYFPTKVLFGTGTEYSDWSVLKAENSTNTTYIEDLETTFGSESQAITAFETQQIDTTPCNTFSGTVTNNTMSGSGYIVGGMRTLNGPDTTSALPTTNSELVSAYNVKGAIKTVYFSETEQASGYLQSSNSDSGRLLKPEYRGIGRPCFIYLNNTNSSGGDVTKEIWDQTSSSNAHVTLSMDSSSDYLNRITFTITLPSQSTGVYYPYNGYTLMQIGLYNDTYLTDGVTQNDTTSYPYTNMDCGTLLAIKNISPLSKTADDEIILQWTLTI